MAWVKLENAYTGKPVHVKSEEVAAVHQANENESVIELRGGGRLTVKGTADAIKAAVDAQPKRGGKELETR